MSVPPLEFNKLYPILNSLFKNSSIYSVFFVLIIHNFESLLPNMIKSIIALLIISVNIAYIVLGIPNTNDAVNIMIIFI